MMPWIIEPFLVGTIVVLIYIMVATWRKWKE
jgi:hypothetical protein